MAAVSAACGWLVAVEGRDLGSDVARAGTKWEPLSTTATIAWAVFASGKAANHMGPTLALILGGNCPATVRSALAWLVAKKDPQGTWYSTQGTVLAF